MAVTIESFGAVLLSLWLRLITLLMIVFLLALTEWLPGRTIGWFFYLTTGEVVFEVVVRAVVAALGAVALGTVCTVAISPFLLNSALSRRRIADAATSIAEAAAAFLCIGLVLKAVLDSFVALAHLQWFPMRAVLACYCIAYAAVLCFPRHRKQLVKSFDGILGEKTTRRAVIVTGIASAALVAGEFAAGKASAPTSTTASVQRRKGPNIVLVTFDALSAEDMSVYGYRLSTTPNIDEFARKSTVFTNYYSASTFTTPCVASILTGLYPSDHHVYQLEGSLAHTLDGNTLPSQMRAGGYSTSASINNPAAYFLAGGIAGAFDSFPKIAHRNSAFDDFWDHSEFLYQRQPFGSREQEYYDLSAAVVPSLVDLAKLFPSLDPTSTYTFSPFLVFEQAHESLRKLPDKFFLWVHSLAPHKPYLPDAPYRGRFLDSREHPEGRVSGRYAASEQGNIDKSRLRYDELLAEADAAFGRFLSELERDGRLQDTAVIVSADHGESFEGGFYEHGEGYQTRPSIHIPLIIRMPGQEQSRRVSVTADQTTLAPTILDIAQLPRPDSMRGQSLVPWLNRDQEGNGEGIAFNQYLETNSIFKPLRSGTVGVIDGRHQYILDLATGKGKLRSVAEAQICDIDRSAEEPALAQTMRETIYSRFPHLPRGNA